MAQNRSALDNVLAPGSSISDITVVCQDCAIDPTTPFIHAMISIIYTPAYIEQLTMHAQLATPFLRPHINITYTSNNSNQGK